MCPVTVERFKFKQSAFERKRFVFSGFRVCLSTPVDVWSLQLLWQACTVDCSEPWERKLLNTVLISSKGLENLHEVRRFCRSRPEDNKLCIVSYRIVFSIHDVSFSFFPLHYITLRGAFSFYTIFCVSMLQCSWLSQVLKALLKECCFLVCVSKVDTSAFLHLCMYQHDSALQRREKKPTLS